MKKYISALGSSYARRFVQPQINPVDKFRDRTFTGHSMTLNCKCLKHLLDGSVMCLLLLLFFICPHISAQIPDRIFKTDYRIIPGKRGELSVEVDNLNFFKNNEYNSSIIKGYTLPGFRLQTKAVYYPLEKLKLELGVHLQRFWGANRYPNMAYLDIAHWKGDQYQKGFHVFPLLRAQVALSDHLNIVLGHLYGAANHNLIEPLYNPELNMTADPEMGLQFLYDSRRFDLDLWVNWESFIFRKDLHQEVFTAGVSTRFRFNTRDSRFHFYIPLQVLVQHRGGEIDAVRNESVQTLVNGAVGIGCVWNTEHRLFKNVNMELDATTYWQQTGNLWPFDNGHGIYARISADIYKFRLKTSYWKCHRFISMFGSPFYGAVSTSDKELTFENPSMFYFGLEYFRELAKGYSLSINLDIYEHLPVVFHGTNQEGYKSHAKTSFSAGICLRVNPSFLIKKFRQLKD